MQGIFDSSGQGVDRPTPILNLRIGFAVAFLAVGILCFKGFDFVSEGATELQELGLNVEYEAAQLVDIEDFRADVERFALCVERANQVFAILPQCSRQWKALEDASVVLESHGVGSPRQNELRALRQKVLTLGRAVMDGEPERSVDPLLNDTLPKIRAEVAAFRAQSKRSLYTSNQAQSKAQRNYHQDIRYLFISLFCVLVIGAVILLLLLRGQANLSARYNRRVERLAHAMVATSDGIFEWEVGAPHLACSKQLLHQMELSDENFDGRIETLAERIYPADLEQTWWRDPAATNDESQEFELRFRVVLPDGDTRWIRAKGRIFIKGDRRLMIGAHSDVSELMEVRDVAERAQIVKTDFLAHLSHEIRTPLSVVVASADVLKQRERVLDTQEKTAMLDSLSESAQILMLMVNNLLDVNKIESEEIQLDRGYFSVPEFAASVDSMFSELTTQKGLHFASNHLTLPPRRFFGDSVRIRQILNNTIGNALKFTDEGELDLEWHLNEQGLKVSVRDTGPGLSESDQSLIFEKFAQAAPSRNKGGTGLGLHLSIALARAMGGDLGVKSELGVGSTFTLTIPSFKNSRPLSEEKSDIHVLSTASKISVLVAEDHPANRRLLQHMFSGLNVALVMVESGREAVEQWSSGRFDLVLMDVQMPVMDGLEATRTIRDIELRNGRVETPIVAMTAHAFKADENRCITAGMTAYYTKPLVTSKIVEIIEDHVLRA